MFMSWSIVGFSFVFFFLQSATLVSREDGDGDDLYTFSWGRNIA